jgi:pyrroline-5-carboxylate reductase
MNTKKIVIIGVGNMGSAIAVGLIKSGFMQPADIFATDKKEASLDGMKKLGISVGADNFSAAKNADVVLLAVKPYHITQVIEEIKPALNPEKILISIVAGVGMVEIGEMAGKNLPIFRVMPNTAIALQESRAFLQTKILPPIKNMFSICLINLAKPLRLARN